MNIRRERPMPMATVDQASLTPDVFVRVRIEYGWFVADIATKGYFQQRSGSHLAGERKVSCDRTLADPLQ